MQQFTNHHHLSGPRVSFYFLENSSSPSLSTHQPAYFFPPSPIASFKPVNLVSSQQTALYSLTFQVCTLQSAFPQDPRSHPGLPVPVWASACCPHSGCPDKLPFSHGFDSRVTAFLMRSALYDNTQYGSGSWALNCSMCSLVWFCPLSLSTRLHHFRHHLETRTGWAPSPVAHRYEFVPVSVLSTFPSPTSAFEQDLHLLNDLRLCSTSCKIHFSRY